MKNKIKEDIEKIQDSIIKDGFLGSNEFFLHFKEELAMYIIENYIPKQTTNLEKKNKLYKVILRGMTHNSTGISYGINYVVADNSDEAYKKVREFLDSNDIGYTRERELDRVELIADNYRYTEVGYLLYL